MKGCKVTEQRR